jgi:hypothetical protein
MTAGFSRTVVLFSCSPQFRQRAISKVMRRRMSAKEPAPLFANGRFPEI